MGGRSLDGRRLACLAAFFAWMWLINGLVERDDIVAAWQAIYPNAFASLFTRERRYISICLLVTGYVWSFFTKRTTSRETAI